MAKNVNVFDVREVLECEFCFTYVETEGGDCVRFDIGNKSFWIYNDGTVEGLDTVGTAMQKRVRDVITDNTIVD